jgi:CRP-like cAMP-binding protein
MSDIGEIFTIHDLPGHLSYALIAVSYWLTRIFWLRVTAIVGLFLEIGYFSLSGGDLRTGVAWDIVFILINLYQLFWLIQERLRLRLPEHHRDVLRSAMIGLPDADIARLLTVGELADLGDGAILTTENQELTKLYFICDGQTDVIVSGRKVSSVGRGSFVGEVAFITGKTATATVTASGAVTVVVFDRYKLKAFLRKQDQLTSVFYELLGRDLAQKIRSNNSMLASAGRSAAAAGG